MPKKGLPNPGPSRGVNPGHASESTTETNLWVAASIEVNGKNVLPTAAGQRHPAEAHRADRPDAGTTPATPPAPRRGSDGTAP